jgi:hypothetical protein
MRDASFIVSFLVVEDFTELLPGIASAHVVECSPLETRQLEQDVAVFLSLICSAL